MARAVCNATPLIYLAKIGKLELLKTVFSVVFIPEQVKNEVVDRGKALKRKDAFIIEKAIRKGWLKVRKAALLPSPIRIEIGEVAVISLAKKMGIKEVLIDEAPARTAAKLFDLTPRGTMFVLLRALEEKAIDLEGFLHSMGQLIEQGFRLREEIYLEATREARKIVSSNP